MTASAYRTEGRVCRKSSVYNQTGETYFQQLSAYNHMSAHLRRVLLAPCVVDSRNKRYTRDRGLGRGGSGRSKSLEKIRMREDIIDGVAFDTEHYPLDVLRMSLECSPDCRQRVKRVVDVCKRCNDWSARSRAGFTSGSVTQRPATRGKSGGAVCPCLGSPSCKISSGSELKRKSGILQKSGGNTRRVVVPLIADRGESKRSAMSDESRTTKTARSRSEVDGADPSYSYDSSFESSSEASSAPGSPVFGSASSRGSRAESLDAATEIDGKKSVNVPGTAERTEEAKYTEFIYDITQEIMTNGLYTDDELQAVFEKHVGLNSGRLDRNRMQSEISDLKMSLNVPKRSDDEENRGIEQFVGGGRFAKFTAEKPLKILDENKHAGKLRNFDTIRFGDTRKPKDSYGKNTAVLADANPELLITERDVLLTLTEMKLDPRQIRSICKSLHNKSRETALTQTAKAQPDIAVQATLRGSHDARSRMTTRSRSLDEMSEEFLTSRSIRNTESRKIYEVPEIDEWRGKEKISERTQPASVKSRTIQNDESDEKKERENMMNMSRSSSTSQVVNRSDDDSSVKSTENQSEEEEDKASDIVRITSTIQAEKLRDDWSMNSSEGRRDKKERKGPSKMNMKRSKSILQTDDEHEDDLNALKNYGRQGQIEKARKTENKEYITPMDTCDTEEPRVSFISHSEFLKNLKGDDASSLPDISERSEGVTGDVETVSDEILTIGSQTTPRQSQVDEATEPTFQVDIVPVAEESSTPMIEEIRGAELPPSLTQLGSDNSENDEDFDENKQVVVASLESLSSPVISPKVPSSQLRSDVHKEEEFVVEGSSVSLESTPRISENTDDESEGKMSGLTASKSEANDSDKSAENVANAARFNSEDKTGDTLSIETELDQPEISSSTSEIRSNVHVKEETVTASSSVIGPKADDHDEERRKSHEFREQRDSRPTTVGEISKSERSVFHAESNSSHSVKNLHVEGMEHSKHQKWKKSISSGCFIRLIGMGNRRGNANLRSGADTGIIEEKTRISGKNEEHRRTKLGDDPITTASDIAFLRKQNFSDSAQSSIESLVETPYSSQEASSNNLKQRPEPSSRRLEGRQNGNSISKRMKTAMDHLIKRSCKSTNSTQFTQFKDETTQISPITVGFTTTTGVQASGVALHSEDARAKLPTASAIDTVKSNCLCILASALVESKRNGNCRPDCRSREFVCDHRCSAYYRSLR